MGAWTRPHAAFIAAILLLGMHRLHREGKTSQATFTRQVGGLQDLSLASKSNYPPSVSCAFNSIFSAFLCHKSKDFFFQWNESEAFQKKNCLVKNMRRDLISKKKRKKICKTAELLWTGKWHVRIFLFVCVQSHICLHTRLNASRLPRRALSAVDLN